MTKTMYGLYEDSLDTITCGNYDGSPVFKSTDPQEIIRELKSGKGYKVVEIYEADEDGEFVYGSDYDDPENFVDRMSNTSAEDWHKAYWYAIVDDDEDLDHGVGSYNLEEAKMMLSARREDHPDAYIVVVDNHDGDDYAVDTIKEI